MKNIILEKQMFNRYILVSPGSDYGRIMWNDISLLNNGIILDNVIFSKNRLIRLLHHIHFSFAINRFINMPLQRIWRNYYSLNFLKLDKNEKACIIFTDISCCRTDVNYLKKISKNKNIVLVLIFVNLYESKKKIIKKRLGYFDLIFTFDKEDANKYNFNYHPYNYSMIKLNNNIIETDCFFVGNNKGRLKILEKIYNQINLANGKAVFFVSGVKKKDIKKNGINYNMWLSYKEVLNKVLETNCVIDIVSENQSGLTLRSMEAICYNKKILTNNQSIKDCSFYDTRFVRLISNNNKIDIDFILKKEKIDYKYNNEFSPIHLINCINKILEKE